MMAGKSEALMKVAFGALLTFIGCCINNVALELLIKSVHRCVCASATPTRTSRAALAPLPREDLNPWASKTSGPLVTTLQFLFIAGSALPSVVAVRLARWPSLPPRTGARPPHATPRPQSNALLAPQVPHWVYLGLALMSGTMSYANNLAFAFNISQPTHMVFRTGGLLASFLVGALLFGRKYSLSQGLAVFGVALGASICTLAEAAVGDTAAAAASHGPGSACCGDQLAAAWAGATGGDWGAVVTAGQDMHVALTTNPYTATWCAGLLLLATTVTLNAVLGNVQGLTVRRYGKAPQEGIFYLHTLPLVVLLATMSGALTQEAQVWSASPPCREVLATVTWARGAPPVSVEWLWQALPAAAGDVPIMWLFAAVNVLSQWVCVQGVYTLLAWSDPLTSTLIMTVRKVVSLFISVRLFGNTFSPYHWFGAGLVFAASALYSLAAQSDKPAPKPAGQEKEKRE